MAAEFYRKSTALYEEFKRRELHYFNLERSINSSYFTKNDRNSSLQDYLERLNKREKETEKSYKDLLKHLEEMGKSTDQMSLKLEKLNALRNAAISSSNSSWPAMDNTFNGPFMSYYGSSFQERAAAPFSQLLDDRMFHVNYTPGYSLPKLDCRSESTQTEHIFCEKCHYPFNRSATPSVSSTAREPINIIKITKEENGPNNSLFTNSNRSVYDEIGLAMKSSIHNTSGHINPNETISEEYMDSHPFSLKSNQDVHKEIEAVNPKQIFNLGHTSTEILQSQALTSTPFKNTLHKDPVAECDSKQNLNFNNTRASLTADSTDTRIASEVKQITTQEENVMDSNVMQNSVHDTTMKNVVAKDNECSETGNSTLDKSEMFEKTASKSDDESINHEFDFLESDRRPSMKSKGIEPEVSDSRINLPENISPGNGHESGSLELSSAKSRNSVPELNVSNSGIIKNVKSTEIVLAPDDPKLESSLSEGLPSPVHHSTDVSNHSESDSLSDKETPFTASAAYQALLGNVAVTKLTQKAPSLTDSESEDEIENAYALVTATRKSSNINFDALLQVQKKEERKESTSEVISKTEKKISKPVAVGNPQNKLSKNTRKVLGLDTSSGSEIELEAKPTVNKIEEDSDEFDFYN